MPGRPVETLASFCQDSEPSRRLAPPGSQALTLPLDRDLEGLVLAVAQHFDRHAVANRRVGDELQQRGRVANLVTVNRQDDVVLRDSRARRWALPQPGDH